MEVVTHKQSGKKYVKLPFLEWRYSVSHVVPVKIDSIALRLNYVPQTHPPVENPPGEGSEGGFTSQVG